MAFCTDKFVILSRNYSEIRYFGREITAKFVILTAKLPRNSRFWPRNYREIDHFAIARYREIWAKKSR